MPTNDLAGTLPIPKCPHCRTRTTYRHGEFPRRIFECPECGTYWRERQEVSGNIDLMRMYEVF